MLHATSRSFLRRTAAPDSWCLSWLSAEWSDRRDRGQAPSSAVRGQPKPVTGGNAVKYTGRSLGREPSTARNPVECVRLGMPGGRGQPQVSRRLAKRESGSRLPVAETSRWDERVCGTAGEEHGQAAEPLSRDHGQDHRRAGTGARALGPAVGPPGVKAGLGLPRNAATGRRYSGINTLILNTLILWGAVGRGDRERV